MTDTYNFSGPQPGYKDSRTKTKGVMNRLREQKRKEALARNAETLVENTRKYRLHPEAYSIIETGE